MRTVGALLTGRTCAPRRPWTRRGPAPSTSAGGTTRIRLAIGLHLDKGADAEQHVLQRADVGLGPPLYPSSSGKGFSGPPKRAHYEAAGVPNPAGLWFLRPLLRLLGDPLRK